MNAYADFDDDGPYDEQFELGNDHHLVDEAYVDEPIDIMDTCGDCIQGRCHWGGQTSRDSIAAVQNGVEFPLKCGCNRHAVSVAYRKQEAR